MTDQLTEVIETIERRHARKAQERADPLLGLLTVGPVPPTEPSAEELARLRSRAETFARANANRGSRMLLEMPVDPGLIVRLLAALVAARTDTAKLCDRYGLPHDLKALLRHLEGNEAFVRAVDAQTIHLLTERAEQAERHSRDHHLEPCESCAVTESERNAAERERDALREAVEARLRSEEELPRLPLELFLARQQLVYLWETNHSCPCGARPNSPNTHPHVSYCPTSRAIEWALARDAAPELCQCGLPESAGCHQRQVSDTDHEFQPAAPAEPTEDEL